MTENATPLKDRDLIDCDADPFVYEGMVVTSHKKDGMVSWSTLKPTLWKWDQQDIDDGVSGHLVAKELEGRSILNANVLWFLIRNIDLIPKEWEDGRYICFWGTIFLNGRGGLCVACLVYGERGWSVEHRYLDELFWRNVYAVIAVETRTGNS